MPISGMGTLHEGMEGYEYSGIAPKTEAPSPQRDGSCANSGAQRPSVVSPRATALLLCVWCL